jgi:hypothetical protein
VALAGSYVSTRSQADADEQARLYALAQLTCLYGNQAMTVTCLTAGYPESVPNDLVPVTQDGRSRLGSIDQPAGRFFARTQTEADRLARSDALAGLQCFYVNDLVTVTCSDIDPALAGSWSTPVDYDSQQSGNPVTVQPARFVSEGQGASQEVANALAAGAARATLVCRFKNTQQTVSCQPIISGGQTLPPKDSTTLITVPAGTVEGVSQADADEQARELGYLQLGCEYCNAFVPPSCYPASYTPQPNKAIPAVDVTSDWSPDVVLGLTAGTVCMSDPSQVSGVAQAVAMQRPLVKDAGCLYVNDEMWFGCLPVLPGSPALPKGGYYAPAYPANGVLPAGYTGLAMVDQLSPNCTPDPSLGDKSYIVIQAGAYPVNTNDIPAGVDPKMFANSQARAASYHFRGKGDPPCRVTCKLTPVSTRATSLSPV